MKYKGKISDPLDLVTKNYTDTQDQATLKEAKSYADSQGSGAESYADTKIEAALEEAKNYADTAKSEAISSASTDATTKANNALSSAKEYADTKKSEAISTASSDASTKANNALSDAKSYADTKKSEAISTAASDATTKANNALTSAKSYADTGLAKKQATLVSGTNIKTINGESVLGSGDIVIDPYSPNTYSNITVSATPTKMSSYNTWDTEQKYGYSATITVTGVTENSLIQNIVMTDTLLSAIANVVTTTTNGLIFYTEDATALSGVIYTLIVSEVG